MAMFTVLRRVDAFIDYTTQVDADDAKEAAQIARLHADRLIWRLEGEHEFDARTFVALDSNGRELSDSECGDFC